MTRGGVDRFRESCRWTIAAAVVRRAQVRSTLDDLPRYSSFRLPRIVAVGFFSPAWIVRGAAGLDRFGSRSGRIPISGPLPHVPDGVDEAVSILRKRSHR